MNPILKTLNAELRWRQ